MNCLEFTVQSEGNLNQSGTIVILGDAFSPMFQLTCSSTLLLPNSTIVWSKNNVTSTDESCSNVRLIDSTQGGLTLIDCAQICNGGSYTCMQDSTSEDTCLELTPFMLQIMRELVITVHSVRQAYTNNIFMHNFRHEFWLRFPVTLAGLG